VQSFIKYIFDPLEHSVTARLFADAGFVALSLVLSPKLKDKGRWREVPATLYAPLDQGAVITNRGATNPAAARYLAFLASPAARKILQDFGYALPFDPLSPIK
jgi:molybdate transport system substrate-binding protein